MNRDVLALSGSLSYVDEIYELYQEQPGGVDPSWAAAFGAPNGHANGQVSNGHTTNGHTSNGANGHANGYSNGANGHAAAGTVAARGTTVMAPVSVPAAAPATASSLWGLVDAYRSLGHFTAKLDPLGLVDSAKIAELDPATWGFSAADMATPVANTGVNGLENGTIGEVVARLQQVYGGSVGMEFMHIASPQKRAWLAERMERRVTRTVDVDTRRKMLEQLIKAEQFERFCHVKYPGTKRFSLEGSESLIPMLVSVLNHGARLGAIEAVIGMAHRGRLTTMETVMRRNARDFFAEFEDIEPEAALGGGDVKYHLGYSTDRTDRFGNTMHVSLTFNPSHLEAVDPVVLGRVRAKQTRHHDVEHRRVLGVLVHGDAAFAGQGLVSECFNFMNLPGYRTGGTVHLIVNNQVGFTASPAEQRSTPYCTDVAKMIECPIWHVNGEDLDAVAQVIEMAMEYRAQFGSDVVVDMYCYRKYGHNEMDEPGFTQPLMYDVIRTKPSPVDIYSTKLIADGVITDAEVQAFVKDRQAHLEAELAAGKSSKNRPRMAAMQGMWQGYRGGLSSSVAEPLTGVAVETLGQIATSMTTPPAGFTPHPKIVRLLEQRAQMGRGEKALDWGMAEMLSYGSLLLEGAHVRVSGQDCARGTFSHRHAIVTDIRTGAEHLTLGQLHADQGQFRIYDSPLSEAGVMGFEFGYSLDAPEALVIWEGQFGDFANGAQVIIDQFITSSEDKWSRLSGLVLLLPHGYEGQGPEHSSARLERFLQMCGEDNIQVCQPTTPAQMFHLLRRQVLRPWRKPLIVMTPKSLLRLPAASSDLSELATGRFQHIMVDAPAGADTTCAMFCSGKVYYDLVDARAARGRNDVAIIRVEQLYPWPGDAIGKLLEGWGKLKDVVWVQDEPGNMGPEFFVLPRLQKLVGSLTPVRAASRDASASPATGSHKAHVIEQKRLMNAAFGDSFTPVTAGDHH